MARPSPEPATTNTAINTHKQQSEPWLGHQSLINRIVEIYWHDEQKWYEGLVLMWNPSRGMYKVKYMDENELFWEPFVPYYWRLK